MGKANPDHKSTRHTPTHNDTRHHPSEVTAPQSWYHTHHHIIMYSITTNVTRHDTTHIITHITTRLKASPTRQQLHLTASQTSPHTSTAAPNRITDVTTFHHMCYQPCHTTYMYINIPFVHHTGHYTSHDITLTSPHHGHLTWKSFKCVLFLVEGLGPMSMIIILVDVSKNVNISVSQS